MKRITFEEITLVLDGCFDVLVLGSLEDVPTGEVDEDGEMRTRLVVTDVWVRPSILHPVHGAMYSDDPLDFLKLEWKDALVNAVMDANSDAWVAHEESRWNR